MYECECVCVCVFIMYVRGNNHPFHKSSTQPHIHRSAVSGTIDRQSWFQFDFKILTVQECVGPKPIQSNWGLGPGFV